MAKLSSRIQRLFLSPSEIESMTGWSTGMIEDYLGILDDIQQLIIVVDNIDVDEIEKRITDLEERADKFREEIDQIFDELDGKQPLAPTGQFSIAFAENWINALNTSSSELWNWSTDTTATDPGTGILKVNNADITLATELYISATSFSGLDASNILIRLGVGDQIILRQYASPSNNVDLRVTDFPIDNGGFFTIPIEYKSGVSSYLDGSFLQLQLFEVGDRKADISVINLADEPVSTSAAAPTPIGINNWQVLGTANGITLDLPTGAIVNNKGRTIDAAVGVLAIQYEQIVGGNGFFYIAAQRSTDGVTWSMLPNSLRVVRTVNNDVLFTTTISGITSWLDGEYFRIVAYTTGNTGQLYTPNAIVSGEAIQGFSAAWTINEQ